MVDIFIINLKLSESELHDLLVELEDLSKNNENEKYETLIRFRKTIIYAIEHHYHKGMHLIETE